MVSVTRYQIIFFPVARYVQIEDRAVLTVLGFPIYKQIGSKRKLLWVTYDAS